MINKNARQVAMVKRLRQTAYSQEVVSSKPDILYWMDVSDASYYIQTMKITKIKIANWGTPKKKFQKHCMRISIDFIQV